MKMYRFLFVILMCLGFMNQILAQDAKVISAFKESYALEKKGDYLKAIDELKKVDKEANYYYEVNLRMGWLYYASGRFTESLAYYQKSVDQAPMAIEARLGLVKPASQLAKWELVQAQYEKILVFDPSNYTANYWLGQIYYGKKDYDKAMKYFEQVINLYPFDYSGMLMYAWTNYFKGNTVKAKLLFNKVLCYSPDDTSAKEGLGLIK
jgi:tetratricopeptide (TPR) repeat protein